MSFRWFDTQRFLTRGGATAGVLTEVFDPTSGCSGFPVDARAGFVCEGWAEGDASVARQVLGEAAQIGGFPGHADGCPAVLPPPGFEGCEGETCPLVGGDVDGSGSRVGSARVVDAEVWTVVGVHGTSGLSAGDQACRVAWLEPAFVDEGDGRALVLCDFNTGPLRFLATDIGTRRLLELAEDWTWLSEVDGRATYQGIATVDHVLGRGLGGGCVVPGVEPGGLGEAADLRPQAGVVPGGC